MDALPTAAHDRVRPLRERLFSVVVKSLVGLGAAGCLAGLAFAAGAVAVFWFVLSRPPQLSGGATVSDPGNDGTPSTRR